MIAPGSSVGNNILITPYQHNKPAVRFIDTAPISDHDKDLICHGNAERILKLL